MNARLFLLPVLLALAGCAVGPDYKRAAVEAPAAYAETSPWKQAAPADAIAKGDWWTLFGDAQLDALEGKAAAGNQDLRAAVARVDQARALARVAKSQYYPTVDANPSGAVFRNSTTTPQVIPGQSSDVTVPLDLSYEVDLWGRVRRTVEGATAGLQATVADYEAVRLALHAEVAQSYFTLRATDAEIGILAAAIELRKQELDLTRNRLNAGASSDLDVARAETELADARAELADVRAHRAEAEHALAVLVGQPAEGFHLADAPFAADALPPAIPAGVPSDLLERRPDVAEAERRMAAANAGVGVATAAFYPVVKLTGAAGFESVDLGSVFNWPSRMWSVGPSLSLPIFEGGRNTANLKRSEAAYDEAVAQYRGQVLASFREVEDGLSGLRNLADRAEAERTSVASSERSYQLSDQRYRAGSSNYLDVIDAERSALQSRRAAIQTLGRRYVASVLLVKALGGGWNDSQIRQFADVR